MPFLLSPARVEVHLDQATKDLRRPVRGGPPAKERCYPHLRRVLVLDATPAQSRRRARLIAHRRNDTARRSRRPPDAVSSGEPRILAKRVRETPGLPFPSRATGTALLFLTVGPPLSRWTLLG